MGNQGNSRTGATLAHDYHTDGDNLKPGEVNMTVYFLGALTILICGLAVWGSCAEDTDTTSYSDEYEPGWEPFEEFQEYRKAS